MCEPITASTAIALASAAASAGGAIMQSNAAAENQAAAIRAKNEGTARMLAEQAQQQKIATDVFNSTLQGYQGGQPQQKLEAAQTADTTAIAKNAPTPDILAGGATSAFAPKVVQDAEDKSIANRVKNLGMRDANLGALTGYGTAAGGDMRGLADASRKINTAGDFARQAASVGNARINADIANFQQAPSPFGELLGTAGQLGAFYAGQNGAFGKRTPPILDGVNGINRKSIPAQVFY